MDAALHKSVVQNALDFVVRASDDLWNERLTDYQQLKYSTIELVEGIELLFKARLLLTDPALVFQNIDKYSIELLRSGDFRSVSYEGSLDRLREKCGVILEVSATESFTSLRRLRNRYVHFVSSEHRHQVLAIQLSAWHHVLSLLKGGFLGVVDEDHRYQIYLARSSMIKSEAFMRTRYEHVKSHVDMETESRGCMVGTCPTCRQKSLLFGDGQPLSCMVCESVNLNPKDIAARYPSSELIIEIDKDPGFEVVNGVGWCENCGVESVIFMDEDLKKQGLGRLNKNYRPDHLTEDLFLCIFCGLASASWDYEECRSCDALRVGSPERDSCPACDGGSRFVYLGNDDMPDQDDPYWDEDDAD